MAAARLIDGANLRRNGNGAIPQKRVLLSSPWYPDGYRTQAWDNPVTDFGDLQFTGHQDIFTLHGHMHELFAHVIGMNLETPSTYLEYPRKEQFLEELDKGWDIVGIHLFYNQVDAVFEMCRAVRKRAPGAKIVLGGYGALGIAEMIPPDELAPIVDHLCIGEGVQFMRQLLGQKTDAPIRVTHLPRGGMTLPWQKRYITDEVGVVVASLGCPYGCDFCGTTKMFNRRRMVLVSPKDLASEVNRIYEEDPRTLMVAVYEEDSFLDHEYLESFGEELRKTSVGLGAGLWVLGGVRSIQQWGDRKFERIARCGISTAFIGVESKFAAAAGYNKRAGDVRETFEGLHSHGIGTVGAWICGWDFHTRENVREDLAYFLSLKPTMHQLTTLCPFPGTDLFRKLKKEGRIPENLRWQDLSFFGAGGGVQYKNFESHELFELIHEGYTLSYHLWGPSLARNLEVQLNGYEWCMSTGDPDLRRRALDHHRRLAMQGIMFMPTYLEFAPNGFVRRWLRELDARYTRLFGTPSTMQRMLAQLALERARQERKLRQKTGRDRGIEIPPPRAARYEFEGSLTSRPNERPWTVEWLDEDREYNRFLRRQNVVSRAVASVNDVTRLYDHLRRRTSADREAVDAAHDIIATYSVPLR